jgi:hypothetical protein
MKAKVKKEYVGQTHPVLGHLVAGAVYEVETLGELFEPSEKKDSTKKPPAPAAEKE